MAVKFELDKKKDQLVPCKAFKNWGNSVEQKTLKDAGTLEKLFTSEEKREEKKKKLQAIAAATKTLPDAGRAWFVDIFLSAFGGKVDDLAKDLFKDLTKGDAFEELEKATSEYNANFKALALEVAKASAALTKRVADAMTPVAGAFGKEFKERILTPSAPQPAQPVAPAGAPAPTAQPTAESIDRELYQSKKLLELGFITENEYLAKLVETKNMLEEANAKRKASRATDPAIRARAAAMDNPSDPNEIARRQAAGAATPTQQNAQTGQPVTTAAAPAAPVQAGAVAPQAAVAATQPRFVRHSSGYGKRDIRKSIVDAQRAFEEVLKTKSSVTKQTWKETLYNMLVNNIIKEAAASNLNSPIDDALAAYGYTPDVVDSLWNDYISKDQRNFVRLDPSEVERQRAAVVVDRVLQQPEVTAAVEQAVATAATDPAAHAAATAIVQQNLAQATAADPSAKAIADNTVAVIDQPEKATEEQRDAVPPAAEKIIQAAEAPKPTAVSQNPKADDIASAISTLVGQTQNDPEGELVKLTKKSGATQQAFTDMEKGVVAESLTHKQQQLVKLQVKKQVLAEYVKTGEVATKTQLNEFFLTALIFAALAGVIAWATSKLWPVLKDAVNGAPASGRSRGGDPAKETQELVQSLVGGYNSQGQLVDINGKAVPDIKTQVKQFKDDLQQKGDVIKTAANVAISQADPNVKALLSFEPFQQTFTASPQTEIAAVITALDAVANMG